MDMISKKLANNRLYAYHGGRFWFWDEGRNIWKESHLLAKKYNLNHEYDKLLTPEDFLSDPSQFQALEDYEVDYILKSALQNAQPCKNAPIDPVEETAVVPAQAASSAATAEDKPAAPSFDFGADDQTNALLLQDAQTFITGNMARIMAAKHAHDLTANHYKGSWGKWCAAVGISRDTGDNMVRVAEQFGNIQLEGKSIFDVQPMKLLYAAAKPSTPEEVKQAVFTGDITTYKEYQEVMAQLKAEKERADAAEAERDKLLGAQNRVRTVSIIIRNSCIGWCRPGKHTTIIFSSLFGRKLLTFFGNNCFQCLNGFILLGNICLVLLDCLFLAFDIRGHFIHLVLFRINQFIQGSLFLFNGRLRLIKNLFLLFQALLA